MSGDYIPSAYGLSPGSTAVWTGEQADKLRAAGWKSTTENGYVLLLHKDAAPGVDPVRVSLNADGTLHLVTTRSDFHRKLAAIVGAP